MRMLRKPFIAAALSAAAFGVVQSATADDQPAREYVVVYEQGASDASARDAIEAAGGTLVKENAKVGVATVRSENADFVEDAAAADALVGAAANKPIGKGDKPGPKTEVPGEADTPKGSGKVGKAPAEAPADEPFASDQWDMKMIGATPQGSYTTQPGSKDVLVGIIDTGVDASHPDIAPNFVKSLSRNFTTDRPDIDGPCEVPSCKDPADVDQGGHGTHVAGTVGAALNGIGVAGVAPKTGIVNLRAGQDSGYFFLQPSVDALTYAGDNGIDVVNMSYYIDPWLYNCTANPADSPQAQQEQKVIIEATQRALRYAHGHGVTLVAAAGNQDDDLGDPEPESTSPDYPAGANYPRDATDDCLSLPTEGDHVMSISALGPSKRKAYYSNYGVSGVTLSAPGGDARDTATPTVPAFRHARALVLPGRGRQGGARRRRQPGRLQDRRQELLGVAAGHVDGLSARHGRRGANGRRVRPPRSQARRADAQAGQDGADHARAGHGHPVPGAEPVRLPGAEQHGPVHRALRRRRGLQRVLRRRHHRCRRGRGEEVTAAPAGPAVPRGRRETGALARCAPAMMSR